MPNMAATTTRPIEGGVHEAGQGAGGRRPPGAAGRGGSVVQPRTEIPNMGAFAYFKDSEGNVVGLWETF